MQLWPRHKPLPTSCVFAAVFPTACTFFAFHYKDKMHTHNFEKKGGSFLPVPVAESAAWPRSPPSSVRPAPLFCLRENIFHSPLRGRYNPQKGLENLKVGLMLKGFPVRD